MGRTDDQREIDAEQRDTLAGVRAAALDDRQRRLEDHREPDVGSKQDAMFETLARIAEAIAKTEARSAEVHDNAAAHLPGATEHAARARRFADAARAAASAYRNQEVPSQDVRQAIRDSRPGAAHC